MNRLIPTASHPATGGKLIVPVLLLAAIGVPVLETWQALMLTLSLLAVVFGTIAGWRRVIIAGAVVVLCVGARAVLPRADIAEAHNAFLVIGSGEPLERALPAEVFRSWKAQFDALYPPDRKPYAPRSQWRETGVPASAFTASSDAIWRPAKYTRQVDAIDFTTLGGFRGGFANEVQYNFWSGELLREQMPFYVMYELTPASVGSALAWRGELFWPNGPASYERIVHPQIAARTIAPADVGRRVYAAFFPKRDAALAFRLLPSPTLRIAAAARTAVTVFAALAVLWLTVRVRPRPFFGAFALFSVSYVVLVSFLAVSAGKYLGKPYPPQGGGDDGIVHDGWGRLMAMLAGHGHILDALQGTEPVYWFTPGTRYVRMVEKLIFGDTNHLFALLVCCVPIVLFYLVRHFTGSRWAWAAAIGFVLMPVENPSFLQYLANAKLGYGEAIGGGLFLLGLALLMRTQQGWGGVDKSAVATVAGGAALAASMFIRPNFALAVVWVGAAYAWTSARRGDWRSFIAVGVGLGMALWMPLHNVYYGHEFHLISKSGATVSVPLGVGDYVKAARDIATGRWSTPSVATTAHQVRGWLSAEGFVMRHELRPIARLAHAMKLLALLWTCWVAVRWLASRCRRDTPLAVVAIAALCAHLPMLFIFTTNYRYAMLGWDLSMIVLFISVVAWVTSRAAAAAPSLSPVPVP